MKVQVGQRGGVSVVGLEGRSFLFSYEIALSCIRLPHHLPLCLYLHLSNISYFCAESVHIFFPIPHFVL